jgi:hypothetical protein
MATLRDLIELLEEAATELGDDAKVRLVMQPSWPLEYEIAGVVSGQQINDEGDEDEDDQDVADDKVLYLVEGSQIGYGSKRAFECYTSL